MSVVRGVSFALGIILGILSLWFIVVALFSNMGLGGSINSVSPDYVPEPGFGNTIDAVTPSEKPDKTPDLDKDETVEKMERATELLQSPAFTALITAILSFITSIAPAFSRGTAIKSTSRVNIFIQLSLVVILVIILI